MFRFIYLLSAEERAQSETVAGGNVACGCLSGAGLPTLLRAAGFFAVSAAYPAVC